MTGSIVNHQLQQVDTLAAQVSSMPSPVALVLQPQALFGACSAALREDPCHRNVVGM